MADRTIDSLTAPNLELETRGVQCSALAATIRIKPGVIQLLPKFGGEPQENPIQYLKEFWDVCNLMKPADVSDDEMMLRVFSFSLKDKAKKWYHTLMPGSASNWLALKKLFLTRYFPETKVREVRIQIRTIKQSKEESLYDYFERYKAMLASYPYHGYAEHYLIDFFHDGLIGKDHRMINSACEGSIMKKTYKEALNIIDVLAEDSRCYVNLEEKDEVQSLKEEVQRLNRMLEDERSKVPEKTASTCPTMLAEVTTMEVQQHPHLHPHQTPTTTPSTPEWESMLFESSLKNNEALITQGEMQAIVIEQLMDAVKKSGDKVAIYAAQLDGLAQEVEKIRAEKEETEKNDKAPPAVHHATFPRRRKLRRTTTAAPKATTAAPHAPPAAR